MKYAHVSEGEVKNKVAEDYFKGFDATKELGNIDFCVALRTNLHTSQEPVETQYLLWAEAKKENADFYSSIVQLILTIGKARTFDKHLPPAFLGAFDAEKIAFLPYSEILDIFGQNDFNWNVKPSDHKTKEFKQVYEMVKTTIEAHSLLFTFGQDDKEIHEFIQMNFVTGKADLSKIRIDKNNFLSIYNKWLASVKPTIGVNWDVAQKMGIIDADFYLADLLSRENETLKEKLYVILRINEYELDRQLDEMGMFRPRKAYFLDKQKAHKQFWNKYERPPKEEYWDYIINRRDLLVPQDVRERKGSFFTPQIWVELSQQYLTDTLGENWQDEYYIWDCAAGTGNLLAGLTNKRRVWASTLDRQDVDVMKDRINNGANLMEKHVFQFDFLNDDFSKLPQDLQEVINNPKKRERLIIYINPPYAEHGNKTTINAQGEHKTSVATSTKVHENFHGIVGTATRELFVQFFLRVYKDIPNTILASFSKLKFINSQNFLKFRQYFKADYKKGFICKSDTFDNVKGKFPIAFSIWDLSNKKDLTEIELDIALTNINRNISWLEGRKTFYSFGTNDFISSWLRLFYDKKNPGIGHIILPGVDMQQQNGVYITSQPTKSDIEQHKTAVITGNNVMQMAIYLAVRQCIEATWVNDRDQFLYPNDNWEKDNEFQTDCLAYTLFHGQNKISANEGTNHWIPFTEDEVDASSNFESNFMTDFIAGKLDDDNNITLFQKDKPTHTTPLVFSPEAQAVFEAGKALWAYYHKTIYNLPVLGGQKWTVNASLYDIREYFQGRSEKGKMNNRSEDETYTALIGTLREKLKELAKKIEPKVYAYGFLKA